MRVVLDFIELVFKACKILYRKFGISGILAVILFLEPGMLGTYYSHKDNEYTTKQIYHINELVGIEKIDRGDERVYDIIKQPESNKTYYIAVLKLENPYSEDVTEFTINVKNQDGREVTLRKQDYYTEAKWDQCRGDSVIPAGTEQKISCLLSIGDEELEKTESLTFYNSEVKEVGSVTTKLPK